MNLLKITTTPLKINVVVEKSKFEEIKPAPAASLPSLRRANASSQKTIKPSITNKRDVYQATRVSENRVESIPLTISAVNGTSVEALQLNQSMQSHDLSELLKQRLSSNDSSQVAYIPVTNTGEIKWEPNSMQLEFQSMQVDLEKLQKQFKFVPSQVRFEIEQYPSIQIEYLGDPQYVPPSANPNFVEEE